jgi:cobyrinic acid a,c-diamide synthase
MGFEFPLPRVCIAASSSGSGKTTLTCGLLRSLINRNYRPASFKCGPDYIDPLFHREVVGAPASNLDLFLLNEATVKRLFHENTRDKDIAVIEGVMGFYDGLAGTTTEASTWRLARTLGTPVVLIEDCGALSITIAARIKGLVQFREGSGIRAVALNHISEGLYRQLKPVIEEETGIKVLGHLPFMKDCAIESRHLGLVTAPEIQDLSATIDRLAARIEETLDIDAVIALAQTAPPLPVEEERAGLAEVKAGLSPLRIGIARDRAFCFYYEDGLELLKKLGAELAPFSPLNDSRLPAGLDGLYLGGGYPELYGWLLSGNTSMLRDVREAVLSGMPCIAECGGFMYLHTALIDEQGNRHTLADVIPGSCRKMPRLVRFGYASYTARADNLLCRAGDTLRGHEFHYWESDCPGSDFQAVKPVSEKTWPCVTATENLYAGFPHLHFCSEPLMAERFLDRCRSYHG